MSFKRIVTTFIFFILFGVQLSAQSLVGVWVEANFRGITKPKIKYAFTHDKLKLRDMYILEQTVYSYYCKDGYIYLSDPEKLTSTNLRLIQQTIKYELEEDKLVLIFDENNKLTLISERSVKKAWNLVSDVLIIASAYFIGRGSRDIENNTVTPYREFKFKGQKVYKNDGLFDPNHIDARGRSNLERMKRGLAPIGKDGKSLNLHHADQKPNGPLYEVSDSMHKEYYTDIHTNTGQAPSKIDRKAFDIFRAEYWAERAKDFEK